MTANNDDKRTEKQKMLDGDLYTAFGPELYNERMHCKKLLYEYNLTKPDEQEKRSQIIKQLFGKVGVGPYIEAPFRCDHGYNIEWGNDSVANHNLIILDECKVTIGNNVLIGPDVKISTATHPTDPQIRLDGYEYGKPITIGNNVWIGGGAIINANVTIGDNSVIGSGSVVTKNIPENVVAVGNPCKVIKKLEPPTRKSAATGIYAVNTSENDV
ncbi:unnamed protein product [Didymodactylos carnosus]|uniref:Maltose/galactoside acetyltransferase domain-containing protein n=1 Tax=Didymodactylos carnosus TaxID=1234261 RepID=A0A8S2CYJ8_9BILA|nr:unnamed protein product [Didymodactylos carnosus]CAF3618727.1 unnamed protein product [Didymodactylos carnosus]